MRISESRTRRLHAQHGFSLIELAIVVAILGVLAMAAAPSITAYRLREQTRSTAQRVASALREARSSAIREGRQYFALFNPGGTAPPGTLVRTVQDMDGNWQIGPGDVTQDYGMPPASDALISTYAAGGMAGPFPAAALVDGDPGAGTLGAVVDGANFPVDPTTGGPAIGFTTQGLPVDLNTPAAWGTGAGAFYFTDNATSVYATVVFPLGEIRVRALSPGLNTWE